MFMFVFHVGVCVEHHVAAVVRGREVEGALLVERKRLGLGRAEQDGHEAVQLLVFADAPELPEQVEVLLHEPHLGFAQHDVEPDFADDSQGLVFEQDLRFLVRLLERIEGIHSDVNCCIHEHFCQLNDFTLHDLHA